MPSTQDAIRARRRLTNKFIAAHEAQRLAPFFEADANLIGGEGGLISGPAFVIRIDASDALIRNSMVRASPGPRYRTTQA